jgi:hypothetical protein
MSTFSITNHVTLHPAIFDFSLLGETGALVACGRRTGAPQLRRCAR